MKIRRRSLLLAALAGPILMTACATPVSPSDAYADSARADAATLLPLRQRRGLTNWQYMWFQAVGNILVHDSGEGKRTLRVNPGLHHLLIQVRFSNGKDARIYQSSVPLSVVLEPGREYQLLGESKGTYMQVWLQDTATGKRLGDPANGPLTSKSI